MPPAEDAAEAAGGGQSTRSALREWPAACKHVCGSGRVPTHINAGGVVLGAGCFTSVTREDRRRKACAGGEHCPL